MKNFHDLLTFRHFTKSSLSKTEKKSWPKWENLRRTSSMVDWYDETEGDACLVTNSELLFLNFLISLHSFWLFGNYWQYLCSNIHSFTISNKAFYMQWNKHLKYTLKLITFILNFNYQHLFTFIFLPHLFVLETDLEILQKNRVLKIIKG